MQLFASILLSLYALGAIVSMPLNPNEVEVHNLGIPLEQVYPDAERCRTVWDLEIYDNQLFIGSGDYHTNAGPVQMMYYDLAKQMWCESQSVPDEQVSRFMIINDQLVAPGSDPKGTWDKGNFYRYSGNQWQTVRTIPGGIHQFDMVQYGQKLFAGISVQYGEYPVAVSDDSGITFQQLPFYKNGSKLSTDEKDIGGFTNGAIIRVYDFFALKGELYACLSMQDGTQVVREIYQYDGSSFQYYSDMTSKIDYIRYSYDYIRAKTEFHGKAFFTTGQLYATLDMKTASAITLGADTVVTDLRVIDNILYVLAVTPLSEEEYRSAIYCSLTGTQNSFFELFRFDFPTPAQCFTYDNRTFYFGMGDGILSEKDKHNGTVLSVSPQ